MENSLRGRRALVTAAAAFAQQGARIHICDIDEAALGRMKSEMPAVSQTRADVASLADLERLFADAQRQLGGLDILVLRLRPAHALRGRRNGRWSASPRAWRWRPVRTACA